MKKKSNTAKLCAKDSESSHTKTKISLEGIELYVKHKSSPKGTIVSVNTFLMHPESAPDIEILKNLPNYNSLVLNLKFDGDIVFACGDRLTVVEGFFNPIDCTGIVTQYLYKQSQPTRKKDIAIIVYLECNKIKIRPWIFDPKTEEERINRINIINIEINKINTDIIASKIISYLSNLEKKLVYPKTVSVDKDWKFDHKGTGCVSKKRLKEMEVFFLKQFEKRKEIKLLSKANDTIKFESDTFIRKIKMICPVCGRSPMDLVVQKQYWPPSYSYLTHIYPSAIPCDWFPIKFFCYSCQNTIEKELKEIIKNHFETRNDVKIDIDGKIYNFFESYNQHCKNMIRSAVGLKTSDQISASISELELRKSIEELFPNEKIVYNSRQVLGEALELDIYLPNRNLAFEYQGKQHYEFIKNWHKTLENFKKNQERDSRKQALCTEKGVRLILISYLEPTSEKYIRSVLKKHKLI